jgi:4-aminobutyrate aminotransferase-like enzyme
MAFSFSVESPENTIPTNAKLAKEIKKEAFINHLIIQTAGVNGDYIKLSPSFFISDEEIDISVKRLNKIMELVSKISF